MVRSLPKANLSDVPVEVLYRDEQLLVVNKPPGLLSQPDHTGDPDVLTSGRGLVSGGEGGGPFLGLVHRLDRPASGVMVLARTSDAARDLSAQFRGRLTEKRYLVVVEGTLKGIGTWTDYIAKPDRQPKLVSPDQPAGKRAALDWQALASDGGRTLLQIELRTGRPHQIRLQATSRGHPVVGDSRYGARSSLVEGAITLHHALLRVEHPARSRRETFVAPPPSVWEDVVTDEMSAAVERMIDRAQVP